MQCVSCLGAHARYHSQLCAEVDTLRQSERERAQTRLMLVHELRAPVTASRSLIYALQFQGVEDPLVSDVLDRLGKRMDQLLELVNDILMVSGVQTGNPLGELEECDLADVTRTGCKPYLEEAADKGLMMTVQAPGNPLPAHLPHKAFQLILTNLVSNAVKYTPSGLVQVSLREEGAWAVLEVTDTGIGIPATEMDQLCSEFFRASNARRSRIPGTGLGLAGVKALVEQAGGSLEVKSEEKLGSEFTVRLPIG
jgi:signal transduction histidine kinase